eukprot:TRINITY_DN67944_c0_g1_i1.p1 TRINITY_DN67944_c0_g1~~TRINITY_DN67944_c0_g1_i1.p1  ORF type:complete len:250 (+),score=25.91 TRINITY_DN67944_c0_g1_i1:103-750(+)
MATRECEKMVICTTAADGACEKLSGHESAILSMAKIGDHLASGDSGSTIKIWDVGSGACVSSMVACHDSAGWVHGLCEIDANLLASCSDTDNFLKLWDLRVRTSPSFVRAYEGPEGECQGPWDICAVSDGGYAGFATVDMHCNVRAYDLRSTKPLWTQLHEEILKSVGLTVAFSEGNLISMAGETIKIWDWCTGSELNSFPMPSHWCGFESFAIL